MKHTIAETHEIIEGYYTQHFVIEAETKEEAIKMLQEDEVDRDETCVDIDYNIEMSECINTEHICSIKNEKK